MTLSNNKKRDTQHNNKTCDTDNDIQLNDTGYCYAECRYAECRVPVKLYRRQDLNFKTQVRINGFCDIIGRKSKV